MPHNRSVSIDYQQHAFQRRMRGACTVESLAYISYLLLSLRTVQTKGSEGKPRNLVVITWNQTTRI